MVSQSISQSFSLYIPPILPASLPPSPLLKVPSYLQYLPPSFFSLIILGNLLIRIQQLSSMVSTLGKGKLEHCYFSFKNEFPIPLTKVTSREECELSEN